MERSTLLAALGIFAAEKGALGIDGGSIWNAGRPDSSAEQRVATLKYADIGRGQAEGQLAVSAQRVATDSVQRLVEESPEQKRARAERYRRLAISITDPSVAQHLNVTAEKLEREADASDAQGDGRQTSQY